MHYLFYAFPLYLEYELLDLAAGRVEAHVERSPAQGEGGPGVGLGVVADSGPEHQVPVQLQGPGHFHVLPLSTFGLRRRSGAHQSIILSIFKSINHSLRDKTFYASNTSIYTDDKQGFLSIYDINGS